MGVQTTSFSSKGRTVEPGLALEALHVPLAFCCSHAAEARSKSEEQNWGDKGRARAATRLHSQLLNV